MQKTALVTGSYKGLGFAIAARLAEDAGMKVILSGRQLSKVQEVVTLLSEHGLSVDAIELDVNKRSSVEAAITKIEKRHGRLDVLVNNAGVNPSNDPLESSFLTAESNTLVETLQTNAVSALTMMQAVVPLMKKHGYGRIVNVSSEMASLSGISSDKYPLALSYRVSKIALNAIVALVAKELVGTDILVNAYSPGWLKTDMGGPHAPTTAHDGAETALYLATLPTGGPSGQFYAEIRKSGVPVKLQW